MTSCPQCGASYPPTVRLCPVDGTVLETPQPTEERLVGLVLDGKYRLDSFLTSGGMGAVFRATHVMLGKAVAVKLIKGDLVTSPETARRFQREARAATSLSHPGIVAVYDLGQTDDGTLYIAMELVEGQSLKDEIGIHGRIDPARIVHLLRQVASALAMAHRHHIIHRDLKPQNVMLTRDSDGQEVAKLLDFGIAKTLDVAQSQLTAAGFVLGTPHYMSPEQAIGKEVDARTDIYSLGVVMYEMLIGEVPFTAPSTSGILVKHMTELPAPPSRRRPDILVPAHLETIVLRCLEKEPDRRYQTADEFAVALDAESLPPPGPRGVAAAPEATTLLVETPQAGVPVPAPATNTPALPGGISASWGVQAASSAPPEGEATRPTVPAAAAEPVFTPRPGSSFGAFGAVGGVIVLISALGGALWLFTERGQTTKPGQVAADAALAPPDTTPATALPADDTQPELVDSTAPAAAGDEPEARTPITAAPQLGAAGPAGATGSNVPATTSSAAAAASQPPGPPARQSVTPPAETPDPVAAGRDAGTAAPQAAVPAPAAAMQIDPSVFVECRGAGEVCGPVRAAFDQALQRERFAIARSSDRADIVLVATVSVIDERRDQQFGQVMAVRTYAIEVMGDAPRLDRVIPMPSPRTFSFDQRFGAERANENARVVAIDAVRRIRAFLAK
jgi:eukaryotic-like serine/threonine-protein kinase